MLTSQHERYPITLKCYFLSDILMFYTRSFHIFSFLFPIWLPFIWPHTENLKDFVRNEENASGEQRKRKGTRRMEGNKYSHLMYKCVMFFFLERFYMDTIDLVIHLEYKTIKCLNSIWCKHIICLCYSSKARKNFKLLLNLMQRLIYPWLLNIFGSFNLYPFWLLFLPQLVGL